MTKKQFLVIGLGQYGLSVARTLSGMGCEVVAVDMNEEKIQEIADEVTYAVTADATDEEVLENLGVNNMDAAVRAITNDMESSIMATICAKECGVPYVLAKANSDIHATVLKRVGADQVIFPEKATGIRLGRNLASGNFLETIELSKKFSMVEIEVPKKWIGKTIRELNLRSKGINIIARKGDLEDLVLIVDPDSVIQGSETFIIIGSNKDLERELL